MITDVRPQRHGDPSRFCSPLDIIWAISYCSETDKNNLLFCGQRVFPAERSWVQWVRGGATKGGKVVGEHRKVVLWLTVEGCQGWILVFPHRPSPSTLSILNMSITANPSAPVGGIGAQKHVQCFSNRMNFVWTNTLYGLKLKKKSHVAISLIIYPIVFCFF